MKRILNKDWFWYTIYLILALIGIWLLTKLWVPEGFIIAGHDSGLAINTGEFLKTRFFAWDDRIDFGSDNSPHFGSIIMHFFDYIISTFAKVPYAGSQLAVFLWIGGIFIFSFIFSFSLKERFGKYFAILFPVFLTFNFFIFQSVFILERAKYELIFVSLIFLTLVFKIFFNEKSNILKYSIIFSLIIAVFNGGGWFGLPLYGGLFVIAVTVLLFSLLQSIKEKQYTKFKQILLFFLLNILFFICLNAYSIFPYVATLINSDFAKVVNQGTINAGFEWLNYISRGSSFLNLFRMQGIPDWYLTGYGANPDHAYASLYLTNFKFIFISFVIPIITLLGLLIPTKEKLEKYTILFFIILFLVSMFFVSGTNSPLGFIYEFLYTRIPGFNIFRSPYYKFAPSYLIAFSFLLSFSLSKIISVVRINNLLKLFLVLLITTGWFKYHNLVFNSNDLFTWQPGKSTLVAVPDYVNEFGSYLATSNIKGRILVVPAFDRTWRDDSYKWGYWSLSPLPSFLSQNANFTANDLNISSGEESWINELYALMLSKDKDNFLKLANRLGVRYIFVKEDYYIEVSKDQKLYFDSINWFSSNDYLSLVKKIGPWSLFSINNADKENLFKLTENIFSIPKTQEYFTNQIHNEEFNDGSWVDEKFASDGLKNTFKKTIYPLTCESCQIENLGKHADIPAVRILPNSPLYKIKQQRNDKSIDSAKDDQAKVGAYLGLIMIKFSEVRSMYELKIEKEFIDKGLKDISTYLQAVNDIITKSPEDMTSFYLASRIYETLNPLQRFFRDYVNSTDINFEKSYIKDDILKVLWQGVSIKKLFDPIIKQEDRWNNEKYYDLSHLPDSTYKLLIDTQTLPVNSLGEKIKPDSITIDESSQEFKLQDSLDSNRFLITTSESIKDNLGVHLNFSNLPDLYKNNGGKILDFPEGSRGCLEGTINNFDNSRMYRFQISSTKDIDNLRLYIKEGKVNLLDNGFLRGDIEVDITAGIDQKTFEYIYVPSLNILDPKIFLCRRDESIPKSVSFKVKEIFSPIVYAVNDSAPVNNKKALVLYKKTNSTKYKIDKLDIDSDQVLIFNARYSGLWKLYSDDGKNLINDHFVVDGYANGWLIKKGNWSNLVLVYEPQAWYERGRIISIGSLLILLILFLKEKND